MPNLWLDFHKCRVYSHFLKISNAAINQSRYSRKEVKDFINSICEGYKTDKIIRRKKSGPVFEVWSVVDTNRYISDLDIQFLTWKVSRK